MERQIYYEMDDNFFDKKNAFKKLSQFVYNIDMSAFAELSVLYLLYVNKSDW